MTTPISRRSFLKQLGGGIVVLTGVSPFSLLAQSAQSIYPKDFNAYLVIGVNGRVTVYSGKIEMGQGVLTSQAQMVADELDVALSSVDMILGDTDVCPYDMGTFGSLTTRMFGPALRTAAAQARGVLLKLAAQRFNVRVDKLAVRDGVIYHIDQPTQRVGYGELSKGARIVEVTDHQAILKTAAEFHSMGTSPKRLDGLEKVTGAAKYTSDIRIPQMLYAKVLRAPMHGAKLANVDTSAAKKLDGVTVVDTRDIVAVLHADPEMAESALRALKADWILPPITLNPANIYQHLVEQLTEFKPVINTGELPSALVNAARHYESQFFKGYVAHAPIETHAALVEIKNSKATVWASTQTPFPTRDRVAVVLGLDKKNVHVITPLLGGGFGGKSADLQVTEAARLAKIVGKPVQVAWSRAEEFYEDRFDPASTVKVTSGTDGKGSIVAWDYAVYAAGERGANCVYSIPHSRIRSAGQAPYEAPAERSTFHPFDTGPWRGPGANMNVFAIESQIDIMAFAEGVDPLTFRLNNLSDQRMKKLMQVAADQFGWSERKRSDGIGCGIACNIDAGTYVATIAEVQVEPKTGVVKVLRIVCAQDMGIVVNPEGAKMQIEGGITMGLGYSLSEEVQFRGGEILDANFDSYQIPRFSWVPKFEIVLVKNDELAPQGGGEPPITTTGAVLANAIFDAVGVRMFQLPMTPERIKAALEERQKRQASV